MNRPPERPSRRVGRSLLAALAIATPAALLAGGAPIASAASFTQAYPFTGSPAGTAGWINLDSPSPNPWYTSSIGTGGLRMAPTGNFGQIYDNTLDNDQVRSGFQVNAPAGATITRAVLTGVDALQQDRQRTRINLLPQPSSGQLTNTESWGRSTINDGDTLAGTVTLTPLTGSTATGLQIRHLTVACGNAALNQPACGPVPAGTPAHARVTGVTLTLDDPTAPTPTINGPAGGWTGASSATVTAGGQDPQSGISRLGLVVKTGGSTRRPVVGTWNQDTTGGSLPGWATTRSSPSTVALPRTGTVTVATVARNGAGTESTSTPITIRVDRTAPTITWPKKLQGGQTITVRDTQSGIATLTAKVGGKTVTTSCTPGAKQCKIKIPTTANGTLRITTTDQAGNDTTGQRTVIPRPKSSGSSSGSKNGSKGGTEKRPTHKPGSKKPTASYCRKHPNARACHANPPRGSVTKVDQDRLRLLLRKLSQGPKDRLTLRQILDLIAKYRRQNVTPAFAAELARLRTAVGTTFLTQSTELTAASAEVPSDTEESDFPKVVAAPLGSASSSAVTRSALIHAVARSRCFRVGLKYRIAVSHSDPEGGLLDNFRLLKVGTDWKRVSSTQIRPCPDSKLAEDDSTTGTLTRAMSNLDWRRHSEPSYGRYGKAGRGSAAVTRHFAKLEAECADKGVLGFCGIEANLELRYAVAYTGRQYNSYIQFSSDAIQTPSRLWRLRRGKASVPFKGRPDIGVKHCARFDPVDRKRCDG